MKGSFDSITSEQVLDTEVMRRETDLRTSEGTLETGDLYGAKSAHMESLKREHWDRWGTSTYPAECDGKVYGGADGSQPDCEYLWVVDQLRGNERKILDIGAGQTLFLPKLLRQALPHVEAIAPDVPMEDAHHHRAELGKWMAAHPGVTREFDCVTCVSVPEHLPDPGVLLGELGRFDGARLIITLELGFDPPGFEYQLSLQKLYSGLSKFGAIVLKNVDSLEVFGTISLRAEVRSAVATHPLSTREASFSFHSLPKERMGLSGH